MSGQGPSAGTDNQALAVDAGATASGSRASAGTGKTQVLSARVLRLLLQRRRVAPEQILCLTFTKAGAAEMADAGQRGARELGADGRHRARPAS